MANKTDKLFGETGDWHYNLMLRYGVDDFFLLVAGYKEAGDRLVHSLESHGAHDGLIYPIIFLYRHYIELSLKLLIRNGSILINHPDDPFPLIKPKKVKKDGKETEFNFGYPDHHDLSMLWELCKGILIEADKQYLGMSIDTQSTWKTAEKLIKEYQKIDPGSDESRYIANNKNNPSLIKLGERTNLHQMKAAMDKLSDTLDGLNQVISSALEMSGKKRIF